MKEGLRAAAYLLHSVRGPSGPVRSSGVSTVALQPLQNSRAWDLKHTIGTDWAEKKRCGERLVGAFGERTRSMMLRAPVSVSIG